MMEYKVEDDVKNKILNLIIDEAITDCFDKDEYEVLIVLSSSKEVAEWDDMIKSRISLMNKNLTFIDIKHHDGAYYENTILTFTNSSKIIIHTIDYIYETHDSYTPNTNITSILAVEYSDLVCKDYICKNENAKIRGKLYIV